MSFDISNFGKRLMNFSQSLTNTAITYGAIKDMSSGCYGNSIWGGGYYGYSGGYGMSYGMNYDSLLGSATQGYLAGAQMRAEYEAEKIMSGAVKTKNEKADAVSQKESTKKGEAFEKATHEMIDKGEAVKDKKFSFMSQDWKKRQASGKDSEKVATEYKQEVSKMGKSYLMAMDKAVGNKDGYISEEEFVKYSLQQDFKPLKSDATEEEKAKYEKDKKQAEAMAKTAFTKLDQNGDNVIDWKESSAMFVAADSNSTSGKLNGEISAEDFATFSEALGNNSSNAADKNLRIGYNNLFKK